ncbi:MAG: hypothetical protein AAB909_03695 [Patescibacteria group bacterium]
MKLIIAIILVLNVSLTGLQFFLTTMRSSDGKALWTLQNKLAVINTENTDLRNQIAQKTSIAQVYEQASAASLSALPVTTLSPKPVAVLP